MPIAAPDVQVLSVGFLSFFASYFPTDHLELFKASAIVHEAPSDLPLFRAISRRREMASTMVPNSADWTPLGNKKAGMIAVVVASTISLSLVVAVYAYTATVYWRHYRMSAKERLDKEERGRRFLLSQYGVLWLNLILGDLIQSAGFSMTYHWLIAGGMPVKNNNTCMAQAILIQIGDVSTCFHSFIIGVHIFCVTVCSYKPPRWLVNSVALFVWVIAGVFAFIGPVAVGSPSKPFYGPAGGWCWISSSYQPYRLYLHYMWVFGVATINVFLYSSIIVKVVWTRRKLGGNDGIALGTVARIMLIYPLSYIATVLPLATYRIAYLNHHSWDVRVALAAGTVFTSSGTVNTIIYVVTRKVVTINMNPVKNFRRATAWATKQSPGMGGGEWSAPKRKDDGRLYKATASFPDPPPRFSEFHSMASNILVSTEGRIRHEEMEEQEYVRREREKDDSRESPHSETLEEP